MALVTVADHALPTASAAVVTLAGAIAAIGVLFAAAALLGDSSGAIGGWSIVLAGVVLAFVSHGDRVAGAMPRAVLGSRE